MNADDEHQRARLERELECTFGWARRDGIILPMFPIISGHQRSSAVLTELFRLIQTHFSFCRCIIRVTARESRAEPCIR
jgi:hypothetical protein